MKHIRVNYSFFKVSAKGKFESILVYSTGMSLDKAIQSTRELHSVDTISEVAISPPQNN